MIAKELRALLPAWATVAAALVASALVRDVRAFNPVIYVIGAAVLGAMSMGHEFSHRTMTLMLTQPVSRRQLLLTKLAVLAGLLLALAPFSTLAVSSSRGAAATGDALRWLPVIASLFMAPALTVATRSPVGGAVFTIGLGGLLMITGEWIGIFKYGYTRDVDTFRVAFMWGAVPLVSAAAAAFMWRAFPRLQVIDGRGDAVDLARHTETASPTLTRRHPAWLLIGKELRLQQLAFAIAAIYVVAFIAVVMRTRGFFYQSDAAFIISALYAGLLTVVIGSMASAEERHLGMIDAQLLLPMSTARQWLVKVTVVLGLTFVLAILLPATLTTAFQPEWIAWGGNLPVKAATSIIGVMTLATVSLYVSTLCSSGIWALVVSGPAAFGVAVSLLKIGAAAEGAMYSLYGGPEWPVIRWATALVTIAVSGIVLRLALANYRSADRSRARIASQIAIVAAGMVAGAIVVVGAGALSR